MRFSSSQILPPTGPETSAAASMTGGLVQEFEHSVLMSITPPMTFALAFLSMIPALVKLAKSGNDPVQFLRALILCSFGSYMLGW